MPNQTIEQAAKELKDATIALTVLLKHENRKYFSLVLTLILVSIVFSIISTTGIISTCFISGHAPSACKIIPGYEKSVKNNKELLKQFQDLQRITKTNQKRIEQLEKENNDG